MARENTHDSIIIRGARQHNLQIPELRIPKKQLVVFTGVSGSGKSSLAFDTLYAEGQRRYVESLSSYARQFLGQMDKPLYDHIKGLSPTIAIEQKAASANPRSTVGTVTEIHDYLRVLYARIGVQHCPKCGTRVAALSTDQIVGELSTFEGPHLLLAPLVENRKGEFRDVIETLGRRGYTRARIDGEVLRLDNEPVLDKRKKHTIDVVVDRFDPSKTERSRLVDSVETTLREGKGTLLLRAVDANGPDRRYSQARACTKCNIGLPELSPQSFSFNSPLGMCPECNGLGHKAEMDPKLLIPAPDLSVHDGAIVPLASVMGRKGGIMYSMVRAVAKEFKVDLDRPWRKLKKEHQELLLFGTGNRKFQVSWRGSHGDVSWPMSYEGIIPMMMRRFRETKSEDMRRYYMQYLADADCSECEGTRLCAESRAVTVGDVRLVDATAMSVAAARRHFTTLELEGSDRLIAEDVLKEVVGRLGFLESVGLDYLTLDRAAASLSGGEAQRIRLASQLGSELSGVMYVLDEPSIGLHQRDNARLIETLRRLRDADNSVIVVEHDAETIEAADYVVDFGPGAGRHGGHVVCAGTPARIKQEKGSLTGRYLSGRTGVAVPGRRRGGAGEIRVRGARANNLANIDVSIPLGTFTAVTGVSGAGKSSLVAGILHPALSKELHGGQQPVGDHDAIEGIEQVDKVIHIDQTAIGRTPRSNAVTYTKAFDIIRDIFAMTPEARAAGYKPSRFSFNVAGGRCDACEGDGVKRVEMHFLPDVYVPCEVCRGRRYNEATLSVRYRNLNIAEVLDLTVAEALTVFAAHPKLAQILKTLSDVGLRYIHLGQPAPTLSGGEAQRVKLSRELARRDTGKTFYVLDEPTTGLHFDDVRKLLAVLDRLVEAGNTVIVIEHNLDVIKCADHVIDLGPEGGAKGGKVVVAGTPEEVAAHPDSYTGRYLREVLR